jgi:hypothetical protein
MESRTIRAGIGNALIWGGAWVVGSLLLLAVLVVIGIVPSFPPFEEIVRIGISFGLTGVVVGASFSGLLRLAYRDKRLLDISSIPFVIGGALVAAVLSPFVGGLPLIATPLGAATAWITLAVAKGAERRLLKEEGEQAMLEGDAV